MRPPVNLFLSVLLLVALVHQAWPESVRACQISCTPIRLILIYLPNVSNWGPQNATGTAELVLAEGEARGQVTGLPAGHAYQVWLMNTQTDDALFFGTFNTDAQQRAQFRFILEEDIPNQSWNLLLITAQPEAGSPPDQSQERRTIGAFFPGHDNRHVLPRELPNTGGPLPAGIAREAETPPGSAANADQKTLLPEVPVANLTPEPVQLTSTPGKSAVAIVLALFSIAGLLTGWIIRGRCCP